MSDETTTVDTSEPDATSDVEETTDDQPTPNEDVDWKDKFEGQRKVNRDLERKLREASTAAQRAQEEAELKNKSEEEQRIELARREARQEAMSAANERLVKAEIKAAAKGQLADPSDALLFLDAKQFEVSEDGDVDTDALNDAITDLLARKPHLAAQKPNRFDGDADQGAKGKDSKPAQLTRDDLSRMSSDEIAQAQEAGRLNQLLGIK